jgi:hypothetical protein
MEIHRKICKYKKVPVEEAILGKLLFFSASK